MLKSSWFSVVVCAICLSLSVVVASSLIWLGGSFEAQAATTPFVKATSSVLWDPVTTDAAGGPETVSSYDLAITLPGSDLQSRPTDPTIAVVSISGNVPPPGGAQLSGLLTGRTAGAYRLWVRAVDAAGNASLWSAPLDIQYDAVAPAIPKNLRIQVSVTVGP